MKKMHYGWWVCIGGALIIFCTSGLATNVFTIYQPYILLQNGFTNTQSSSIITVRSLFGLFSMFLTAPFYKRVPLRLGLTSAVMLIAAAFAMYGLATTYFAYLLAAAVTGIGWGLGTMIPIAMLLEKWFTSKRTTAVGICYASTGISTLGLPSLLTNLVEAIGMRATFLIEAAGTALIALLAFALIRNDPARMGLRPIGQEEEDKKGIHREVVTLSRGNWIALIVLSIAVGSITCVSYSHLTVLTTSNGFSPQISALAITVAGAVLTVTKFVYGRMTDSLGVYRCNYIFGALMLTGMVMLCLMKTNTPVLFVGISLYAIGMVLGTVGLTTWAGDLSGKDTYAGTVRRFQICYSLGGLLFSSMPGMLADRFNGSYVPAFIVFILCSLYMLITIQVIYRQKGLH